MPFVLPLARRCVRALRLTTGQAHRADPDASTAASADVRRVRRRRPAAAHERRGFALEATLIVLVLVGVMVGLAMTWALTVTRSTSTDYRGSRVAYAAEAGADAIMAQLEAAMQDGVVSSAELSALTLPTLTGFTYQAMRVTRDSLGMQVRPINSGSYAGLYALNLPIEIGITARDALSHSATVDVTVNAQSIPLFQFGVFYEGDLEIHNGPRMDFEGWVHTNADLYLTSNNTYFASRITTPDSVMWRRKATSERLNGVYINNDAGTPVNLRFDSRSAGSDPNFRALSASNFDSRVLTAAHGVRPLRLPLPAGMPPIELIRPRNATDDVQTQSVKFAWKADWLIDVDLGSPATLCSTGGSVLASLRAGGKQVPSSAQCSAIFRFTPNMFREGREDIGVDALDIDVGALRSWVGGISARETRILYVTFHGGAGGSADFPALRLVNASRLPNPLTIATSAPLYVKGDYNSLGWQPSALLADAVTFITAGYNEGSNSCGGTTNACNGSYSKPTANPSGGTMSVYAAIAAGHSATPCDINRVNPACSIVPPYGGGLENFPAVPRELGRPDAVLPWLARLAVRE